MEKDKYIFRFLNNLNYSKQNLDNVKNYLNNQIQPNLKPLQLKKFIERYNQFTIKNNVLFYKNLEVIENNQIEKLNELYNDDKTTKSGIKSFYNVVQDKYINIGRDEIKNFYNQKQIIN